MNYDTDPMLGDDATQKAYLGEIEVKMREIRDELRASRRKNEESPEQPPVMLGSTGVPGGMSTA